MKQSPPKNPQFYCSLSLVLDIKQIHPQFHSEAQCSQGAPLQKVKSLSSSSLPNLPKYPIPIHTMFWSCSHTSCLWLEWFIALQLCTILQFFLFVVQVLRVNLMIILQGAWEKLLNSLPFLKELWKSPSYLFCHVLINYFRALVLTPSEQLKIFALG